MNEKKDVMKRCCNDQRSLLFYFMNEKKDVMMERCNEAML